MYGHREVFKHNGIWDLLIDLRTSSMGKWRCFEDSNNITCHVEKKRAKAKHDYKEF